MAKDLSNEDIAARLAELTKSLVTKEKVEEISAAAALDVLKFYESEVKKATLAASEVAKALEKREFARRVAASFDDRVCRRTFDGLVVEAVQDEVEQALARNREEDPAAKTAEEIEEKIEEKIEKKIEKKIEGKVEGKVKDALSARLPRLFEDPEFARKLKKLAGGSAEVPKAQLDEFTKRLAGRMDKIEKEALPRLVDSLVEQKLKDKLPGAASGEEPDGEALQRQALEIANTTAFKAILNEKFKVMMEYLVKDVIPKQVRRIMGGGG